VSARCSNCGRLRPRLVAGQCPTIQECQEWLRAKAEVERKPVDPITAIALGWRDVACTSRSSPDCRREVRVYDTGAHAKCQPCTRTDDARKLERLAIEENRQRRAEPALRRMQQQVDDEYEDLLDACDEEREGRHMAPLAVARGRR
jgi:hypothetical protein